VFLSITICDCLHELCVESLKGNAIGIKQMLALYDQMLANNIKQSHKNKLD